MNKFRGWVKDIGGVDKAAMRLGKSPRAVYHWLRGVSSPSAKTLHELVKMGKGAFDYQDVIDATVFLKK